MAGTVTSNIRAAASDVDNDHLERVAASTGLADLPDGGLERTIGEGGAGLSTGQRQLVAGSALASDPVLLILDEATAHIDSHAEARVQDAVERGDGRGILLIAHRLATVRKCDEIILLRDGGIVERGSHADLMRANGAYAELERAHRGDSQPLI